jgi:hypothetical protein
VASAQRIEENGFSFVFTDGHGTMALSDFFDDLSSLNEVDWQIMKEKYWADTDQDPDRKRRRQAEFLIYERLSWTMVEEIVTINNHVQSEVIEIINKNFHKPPVNIKRSWYY